MSQIPQSEKPTEDAQLMTPPGGSLPPTKERKELLLGMYQENRCQARHYETVRATVVSFTLAAAVAMGALIAKEGLNIPDRRLILVLAVIGFYGTIFTSHYFKRIDHYEQLADEFCGELDQLFGASGPMALRTIRAIQEKAKQKWKTKFSWRGLWNGKLTAGEIFRMYWPITIAILPVLIMQWKFSYSWWY